MARRILTLCPAQWLTTILNPSEVPPRPTSDLARGLVVQSHCLLVVADGYNGVCKAREQEEPHCHVREKQTVLGHVDGDEAVGAIHLPGQVGQVDGELGRIHTLAVLSGDDYRSDCEEEVKDRADHI